MKKKKNCRSNFKNSQLEIHTFQQRIYIYIYLTNTPLLEVDIGKIKNK